jgi:two-component system, sporulation sensor kinase B
LVIVKEILLQQFFALMPFVMFNIYYRDKMQNYDRKFIMITCSICLFLSMIFGSSVIHGFFYDVRFIMIFFGLLFGGLSTGFLLLIEFVVFRLYLGGAGTWPSMVTMAIAFPLAVLLYNIHQRTQRKSLVILTAGLIISIIPLATVYYLNPADVMSHLVFHILAIPVQNAIGIWVLIGLFKKAVSDKQLFISYAQSERTETISHVAASLVHEVRNPLTAVRGFLQLIRKNYLDRRTFERYIDICEDEIQRTDKILSEYLSLTKPESGKQELLDLHLQLPMIWDIMKPYATMNNVQLELDNPPHLVHVYANPIKLKQILVNFIKNAIEACTDVPNGKVTLRLEVDAGKALLTITDNGVGMNEEQVKHLGTIYFSTKTKGTGLGLTFSYQVIHELGGSIRVRSEPNAGTQFVIQLPIA